jgi:hypothetical protein
MKILYFIFLTMLLPSLTGCASFSKMMAPTGQAMESDVSKNYMAALTDKYQPSDKNKADFKAKVAQYDEWGAQEQTLDTKQKEADKAEIASLTMSGLVLRIDIGKQNNLVASLNRDLKISQKKKETIEANIAKLEKQNADAALQKQTVDLAITEGDIVELQGKIAGAENDKAYLDAKLAMNTANIKSLNEKKYESTAEISRKRIRAEITKDFLAIADFTYYDFKTELLAGRAQTDSILDIAELVLSSATTLTGGVMAKTNLGAASTLMKGSRATIDKNFFAQQTMRAIINAMEDGRATDKELIIKKLQKSTTDYPLSEAVSDVMRYQSRASLFVAILDIANKTGASADKATKDLHETEKQTIPATTSAAE